MEIREIQAPIGKELASVSEVLSKTLAPDILEQDKAERLTCLAGGELVRPSVVLFAALAGDGLAEPAIGMAVACELFHIATWAHDAVIDGVAVRGWPHEWMIINGDHIFSTALTLLSSGPKHASQVAARMITTMARGEISYVRETAETSPQEHLAMIAEKYGSLFGSCAELGALCGDLDTEALAALREYGRNLGIAYKIGEEILNLEESVSRGRMTLSFLHAIEMDSAKAGEHKGKNLESVRELCERTGGTKAARRDAEAFAGKAILALSESGIESEPMRDLCTWVSERMTE